MPALRQLLLILVVSFAVFYGIGISKFEWSVGNFDFAKADVEFPQSELVAAALPSKKLIVPKPLPAQTTQVVVAKQDSTPKKILLIGDSMAEGLMIRMMDYADASGHQLKTVSWYGSGTRQYGKSDTIRHFIQSYKPDFVIITLGTNEMKIPHIGKQHREYLQKILSQVAGVPFVWVGPPSWNQDTGISALIDSMVGSGRFFATSKLLLPRREDGIHPTRPGFATWADSVSTWLRSQSAERLFIRQPAKAKYHPKPDVVVLRQS